MKKNLYRKHFAVLLALSLCISILPVGEYTVFAHQKKEHLHHALNAISKVASIREAEENKFEDEVIRLVNLEREKAGEPPVSLLDELKEPSDLRAEEISIKFSHLRPDGLEWSSVFTEFAMEYTAAGENLAYGFTTPEAVVKAWMASESHKANILYTGYSHIGIGYYKDAKGIIYLSQLFYSPISPID